MTYSRDISGTSESLCREHRKFDVKSDRRLTSFLYSVCTWDTCSQETLSAYYSKQLS